jgi:dihydroflavonol-4-reductase
MKAFITGATGFVGSHVARALASSGADLRLLVRASSRTENLAGLNAERQVELTTGDLLQPESLAPALAGCDALFHVAADYRLWMRHPEEMYRCNVDGTRALLEAARKAGVRRAVVTSSVATMGFTRSGEPADEDSPVALAEMVGHYKRSKFVAEQAAIAASGAGFDVVVVNPTTPVGEQDIKPTPTGRIVVDFLKRKFPAYVDTGLNLVDVREVARAHVLAFERGRGGERYILGGENVMLKQLLDRLAAITGLPSPNVRVPLAVAMAAALVDTGWNGYLRGREPRATVDSVRMARKKMWASSAKAERELGFRTIPVEDALRRAVSWFVEHGYAPAPPKAAISSPQSAAGR